MYLRLTIMVYGDKFYPRSIVDKIITELKIEDEKGDLFDAGEYVPRFKEITEYGTMSLTHPEVFSNEGWDDGYEREFVDFFENNYELLKSAGADDFRIFIDVYYSDQCAFEIFSKEKLKTLAKYDVSLPIDVYKVSKKVEKEAMRMKKKLMKQRKL